MPHRIDVEKVLLHELMEESPDYIFIKDRQSRFVATNKAQAQLLLGLENPMDAVGKTDFDLFPGKQEDVKRFYEEEQQIMETGKPVIHRQWMVPSTTTGRIVWLSESKLPIRSETGEVIGIFGLGRDITIQKHEQLLREKLSYQLDTAVQLARATNGILDPRELTQKIVDLVQERFHLYYVGLFLVDQVQRLNSAPGEYAILRAATGEVGKQLLSQTYKIKIGRDSMVGQCVATGEPRIVQQNIELEDKRLANPLLPGTRAEMALPLISRQETIGALNIQSTVEAAFTEQDISVFEVLASLLATAIQNAFLFNRLDEELKMTKKELQAHVLSGWDQYTKRR
ncbi:MAG: GAF domain-containing protein [Anaerolineae bacterium]|jgi:PAS domain S-box-containing protein|nr:GAF domain-containing protein [Anaerolineae bacterium]